MLRTITTKTCWSAMAIVMACGALCGCRSSKPPASGSIAAVEVKGHSTLEIARALSDTFQKAGFTPVPVSPGPNTRMVFEKPGSTGDTVMYGDWSFKKLWYRAKIRLSPSSPDSTLVSCDAFRVFDHGSAHFEEEKKLSRIKGRQYQDLLDEAKAKLEALPRN